MKKKNRFFLITFSISFVMTWICFIFWSDKNEFDFEFREKGTTTAEIYNTGTDEVVEELYDGRKTNVYEVNYIEYSYYVNGKNYKYGSDSYGYDYSVSDKIEIEYLKNNPSFSKIKGFDNYRFNYFVRNLITVGIISFILMLLLIGVLDFFPEYKDRLNEWFEKK